MPSPSTRSKFFTDQSGNYRVVYDSNVDAVKYYMHELTRAALKDVAKYVIKVFNTEFYKHFRKHSGDAKKATKYKVWASAKTISPRVEIGLKTGRVPGFYAYFQEFGTKSGIPRLGLLTHAAQDNIAEIVKIESRYLSGLSDEAERLEALVNEDDMEGGEDDNE